MTFSVYNILVTVFIVGFLYSLKLMNSPVTAARGNLLGGLCILSVVAATILEYGVISRGTLWISMGAGGAVGLILALKTAIIRMPQLVALLNGLGGGASTLTAFAVLGYTHDGTYTTVVTAGLAIIIGSVTFSGSMIAAAKLEHKISQKPIVFTGHNAIGYLLVILMGAILTFLTLTSHHPYVSILLIAVALTFGIIFTIRIGGADMPVTISLLNSLSGLAASVAGFTVRNPILIAVGAVVGAGGFILTQIMCRAMNRTLYNVVMGRTTVASGKKRQEYLTPASTSARMPEKTGESDVDLLRKSACIIIVPGYGMALSQAQHAVKALYEALLAMEKDVQFAIHPVAGRMPGHMNVLLAEADIPYDRLLEMDDANKLFKNTDVVLVVGANDVVNPAAATAEGTPIYGMPILTVAEAKRVIIFNLDEKPGYAGVENSLYGMDTVTLRLGDAKEQIQKLTKAL